MTDIRAVWLLSMSVCSTYKDKMEENISKSYTTSEQHKVTSSSTIAGDKLDTQKVIFYLQEINPFSNSDSTLPNIANGVTAADDEVDVCDFISIGGKKLEKMESAEIFTISFKKCESQNLRLLGAREDIWGWK